MSGSSNSAGPVRLSSEERERQLRERAALALVEGRLVPALRAALQARVLRPVHAASPHPDVAEALEEVASLREALFAALRGEGAENDDDR